MRQGGGLLSQTPWPQGDAGEQQRGEREEEVGRVSGQQVDRQQERAEQHVLPPRTPVRSDANDRRSRFIAPRSPGRAAR